jgi:hypothetical protein
MLSYQETLENTRVCTGPYDIVQLQVKGFKIK